MTINPDGRQSEGVPPSGSGYSAEPCPFCATDNGETIADEDEWDIARVECRNTRCRASGPHVTISDFLNVEEAKGAAVDAWNSRRHA